MTQSKVIVSNLRGWCNDGYWVTTLQHGSLEHWATWPEGTFAEGTECWPENFHYLYFSEGSLSCILLPQKRYWGCGCSYLSFYHFCGQGRRGMVLSSVWAAEKGSGQFVYIANSTTTPKKMSVGGNFHSLPKDRAWGMKWLTFIASWFHNPSVVKVQ